MAFGHTQVPRHQLGFLTYCANWPSPSQKISEWNVQTPQNGDSRRTSTSTIASKRCFHIMTTFSGYIGWTCRRMRRRMRRRPRVHRFVLSLDYAARPFLMIAKQIKLNKGSVDLRSVWGVCFCWCGCFVPSSRLLFALGLRACVRVPLFLARAHGFNQRNSAPPVANDQHCGAKSTYLYSISHKALSWHNKKCQSQC